MTRSVLCPKCKSLLPFPFRPRDAGVRVNVLCPNCDRQVDGLIVDPGPPLKNEGGWAKETEPTKEVEEEAEVIASAVPGIGALYVLGNTKEVAKLLGLRLLSFTALFLLFGGTFTVHQFNPYFLVAASCIFILLGHICCLISDRVKFPTIIKDWDILSFFTLSVFIVFILLPLLVFEVLLLTINPLFFLLDLVIAVVLLTTLGEKKPNA
jgi:hypothetical protein